MAIYCSRQAVGGIVFYKHQGSGKALTVAQEKSPPSRKIREK